VLPTVADVLRLDPVRRGNPQVVAGEDQLDRTVRWVHVSELADIAGLLRGGELILTTGVALPTGDDELSAYVADLQNVGAAGLVVELGRRYTDHLPPALVRAAAGRGLPLVALHREIRFIAVTEAVHSLIVDGQLAQLRASDQVHRTFTEMAVEGATPADVVRQAARMAGRPVVLENLAHQVLGYDARDLPEQDLLDRWEQRSRAVAVAERTGYDPRSGWLVTTVGARGNDWGRLVLLCSAAPGPREHHLLERAASTLALNRMVERDRESLERQTHRTLLVGIIGHAWPTPEIALRSHAVGVPLEGRHLVALVLRPAVPPGSAVLEGEQTLRDLADEAAAAVRRSRLTALVGVVDDASVGILLSVPTEAKVEASLDLLGAALRGADGTTVLAVGSAVNQIPAVRRSFLEASHVADAAAKQPARPFHRLEDVRLRGLLHLLRDDSRLQTYVERELGPLLAYDAENGTELVALLRTYLEHGRNKSAAAHASHLSRPAFYERLHRIERVGGLDLDDVDACLSLHVAVVALDAVRR
jgi:purine catabolism regulator